MKKIFLSVLSFCTLIGLLGCNAFLELEPLDKVSGEQLTETEGGLKALLANIYTLMPIEDFTYRPNAGFNQRGYDGVNATSNIAFFTDEATRSDGAQGIGPEGFDYWPYSDIRQVNIFMENVRKAREKGTISEDSANRLLSEAHFVRAYIYYGLVKRYGGVPLVEHVQDDEYVPGNPSSLAIPRSTELDTWKFVLTECDLAVENLPEVVSSTDGVYRASKWAAYALKSRVALHAASVAKYWLLYVKPDLPGIISLAMQGQGQTVDAHLIAGIADAILKSNPFLLKTLLGVVSESLDNSLLSMIAQMDYPSFQMFFSWIKEGIPMQIEKENGHTHIYLNREALSPLIAFIPNLQPVMEGIPNFGPMLYNSYLGPLYDNWSIITQLDLGLDLTDKNE